MIMLQTKNTKTRWQVVVSNMFYFHPYLVKIPNLTNIFQRSWFNHQPVYNEFMVIYRYSSVFFQGSGIRALPQWTEILGARAAATASDEKPGGALKCAKQATPRGTVGGSSHDL